MQEGKDEKRRHSVLVGAWHRARNIGSEHKRDVNCGFNRSRKALPPIVEQTCVYLERNALNSEGIFRISGTHEDVRLIKDKYEKDKKVDLEKEANVDTVAGVLKLFFKELTNPILTYELYDAIEAALRIEDPTLRLWCVRRYIAALPCGNQAVLERVCTMFFTISQFAETNLMPAQNIAMLMTATWFRREEEGAESVITSGRVGTPLIRILVEQYNDVFLVSKKEFEKRVKELEDSISPHTQRNLDTFADELVSGVIHLGLNIVNKEGEQGVNIQFEDQELVSKKQVATPEEIRQMSFEDFAASMGLSNFGEVLSKREGSRSVGRSAMRSRSSVNETNMDTDGNVPSAVLPSSDLSTEQKVFNRRSASMSDLLLEESHPDVESLKRTDSNEEDNKKKKKEKKNSTTKKKRFKVPVKKFTKLTTSSRVPRSSSTAGIEDDPDSTDTPRPRGLSKSCSEKRMTKQ